MVELRKPSEDKNVVMMLYGPTGVGKTTFASTMPSPVILSIEKGDESLVDTPLGDLKSVADIHTIEEFNEAWQNIVNGEWGDKFDSVVIDSLTEFQERLMDRILEEQGKNYPTIREWGIAKQRLLRMIRNMKDLGMNLLFICAEKEENSEGIVCKRPSLTGGDMPQRIGANCDIVGYYSAEQNEQGDLDRKIFVEPDIRFYAKHRLGEHLDSPIKPDFEVISNAIEERRENRDGEE